MKNTIHIAMMTNQLLENLEWFELWAARISCAMSHVLCAIYVYSTHPYKKVIGMMVCCVHAASALTFNGLVDHDMNIDEMLLNKCYI